MIQFTKHTIETAPEGSKAALEGTKVAFSFVPNLQTFMAESPALLNSYGAAWENFSKQSSFSPIEQQVVLITVNYEHNCTYCMAGHSTLAQMVKMDEDTLNALRNGTPIADKKLQSLHEFTRKVVESRGFVSDADVDMFINAGYTKANILDVVAGVALKVMSNYTNHITKTPVDDFAKKNVWIHPINRTNVA
jgi:alkylhydroperoxidase family enzyme